MDSYPAIKLLLTDVDGTLVTSDKRLTDRALASVERLRSAGVGLAIISGRPPRGMAMLNGPLALATPVIAFNGGMFVTPDLAEVLEQRCLPVTVAEEVVTALASAGLDVWVYRGSDWFIRRRDAPHVTREEQTVQFAPIVIDDLGGALEGAVKIVGVSDDLALVARCEGELRQRFGAQVSAARSQPYYLDVTHPDANKAAALRWLSRTLGVPLSQVACIGDMPNDVLMFGLAGLSIAMGNASPDVQRCARHVTSSNDEEGFACAVDRFVLGARADASPRQGQRQQT
ncbi:Cof-type HAD-IIB family hydrolase [Sorangium sp. So ce176]|uniref:Cof-type HAD-IIB family hydrolase n=1 Tax=Sorangium sp. So ce176 TaxID=3133286 RepID=UPI003F63C44B